MVKVFYEKLIKACPSELCGVLLDHHNLRDFFNATFKVVKKADIDQPQGGKGCVREVSILGIRFCEKIIKADENGIHYCVVNNFPVKAHAGHIRFQREGNHTLVAYSISCQAPWFIPNRFLQRVLQSDVEQCLHKLGERFDPR